MPIYSIQAPNGKTYEVEAPAGANPASLFAFVQQQVQAEESPEAKRKARERTWGEAATDIGASAAAGLGSLVKLPGQLYGLATGDMSETGVLGLGSDIEKWGEERKSAGLRAREAQRAEKIQRAVEEKGQLAAAKTAFGETLTDPALLSSFVAEQLPQLLVPGAAAKFGAKAAMARGAGEAAAIGAGTRAAVGAGAVQQGADVGAGAFESMHKELTDRGMAPEEATAEVLNKARAVGVSGAIISLLAQRLPGAQQMERILAGERTGLGRVAGAALGAIKEVPGEVVEETGGRLSQNIAMRDIKPEQSLTAGLGETAGMAAIGGVGLGGVSGALGGGGPREKVVTPPAEEPAPEAERLPEVPELSLPERAQKAMAGGTSTGELIKLQQELRATPGSRQERKANNALADEINTLLRERDRADREGAEAFPALAGAEPTQMEMRFPEATPTVPSQEPAVADPELQKLTERASQMPELPPLPAPPEQLPLFSLPAMDRAQAALQSQVSPDAQQIFEQLAYDQNVPDSVKSWAADTKRGRQTIERLAEMDTAQAEAWAKKTKSEDLRTLIYTVHPELAPAETPAFEEKPQAQPGAQLTETEAQRIMQSPEPTAEVMRMQEEQDQFNKARAARQAERVKTPLQRAQEEATARRKEQERWAEYDAEIGAQLDTMWAAQQQQNLAEQTPGTQGQLWLQGGEGRAPAPKALIADAPKMDDLVKQFVSAREAKDDAAMTDIAEMAKVAYGKDAWAKAKYEATSRRQGKLFAEPKAKPAEKAAPETAAPETAAPETAAPALAPETTAPETVVAPAAPTVAPMEPAQVISSLREISQKEGNSDTGKRARQYIQAAQKAGAADMDVAAAFVQDYKEAKPAAKPVAKKAEPKPAPAPVKAAPEKTTAEKRESVKEIEAKLDAEMAKDTPNETRVRALEEKLSIAKRGVSKQVSKDLLEVARELDTKRSVQEGGYPLSQDVRQALADNDLQSALGYLIEDAQTEFAKKLASRLYNLLGNTKVELVPDLKWKDGTSIFGEATVDGRIIRLNSTTGMDEETLLHEAVHAASERVIRMYRADPSQLTPQQRAAVQELQRLWEHVKADPSIETSIEAHDDLSEFVTEAMTNEKLQRRLSRREWDAGTLWTQFKRVMLKMLGVTDPKSMLDAATAAMDTIFVRVDAGVAVAATKAKMGSQVQAIVDGMEVHRKTAAQQLVDTVRGGWNAGVMNTLSDNITKFRTTITDKAATIEQHFAQQFNGAARDAYGKVNPMLRLRQAEDAGKMMLEFFQQGSIKFDNNLKLWRVVTDPKVRPPAAVYDLVKQWAKSEGKDFEKAKHDAGRVLEAVRLYELRKAGADVREHMTDNEINTLYAAYKAEPLLQEMTRSMDESRKAMVDQLEKVGRLTPEMAKEWRDVVGYVPFDRERGLDGFEDVLRHPQKRAGRGLAQLGKLPELVGSPNRPVKNAFDNYINTMGWMMSQVVRTDAVRSTLRELEGIGRAKYTPVKPRGVGPDKVVRTYIKGEERYFILDSAYDAAAFNDRNAPLAGIFKLMGQFSNVLRTAITAIPTFSVKQVAEDIQRAALNSGVKDVAGLTKMALANFAQFSAAELKGVQHPAVKLFGEIGLTGEYDWMSSDPAMSLARDLGLEKRHLLGSTKLGNLLHKLDGVTRASDLAIRKAIYDMTLKESGGDQLLAQTRAREIINFRRRGAGDRWGALNIMVQTVPFFNAYLQGMDVLFRAATGANAASGLDKKVAYKMFWSRAATLGAISTMYALAGGGDDEAYDKMSLDKRDKTWVLGGGVAVPVPTEIGILFKAIPERVIEYFRRNGTPEEQTATEAITSWFRAALDTYAGRVIPLPQAMRPGFEIVTNHSFLTGRELEGIYQKQLDPSQRTAANTSELAKTIATFTRDVVGVEVSPISIDTVLNGYFGTTAALLTATTDALLNPDKIDRPLHKMVGLAPFTYDPVGTKYINEFYDVREKVVRAHNTLLHLQKNRPEAVEAFVEEHREYLALNSAVNATLEQLQRTRAYRNWLSTSAAAEGMSSAERLEAMQGVQQYEQELVRWIREAKAELKL